MFHMERRSWYTLIIIVIVIIIIIIIISEFRLFKCFSISFVFSFKRATSSADPKFIRFSPLTLIPLEISAFLKTFSITAVNGLGESGSPCLTPLFVGNSSDTN